ncbi:hypothetical protein CE161_03185 [Bifidobacterium longum]|nr:hypothetical protein CE161_03185 [Bifidobacterium longum]
MNDAKNQIENGKDQLASSSEQAVNQASSTLAELSGATAQIASADSQLTSAQTQLAAGAQQLTQGQGQLTESWQQLSSAKTQLDQARTQLDTTKQVLDKTGQLLQQWQNTGLTGNLYDSVKAQYDRALSSYNDAVTEYKGKLNEYNNALQQWNDSAAQLSQGSQEYQQNAAAISQAANLLASKQTELGQAVSMASGSVSDGTSELIEGQRSIDKAKDEYNAKLQEFNDARPVAEKKIKAAEHDIELAREKVDTLEVPAYSIDGRRECLTSEGYRVYEIIANIVKKLAMIFPVFLYFVTALVMLTTMGRMVDEERTNSGILKALGYSDRDIMKKFLFYGFTASTIGTIIRVAAGHTMLPIIVNHAYSNGFTMAAHRAGVPPYHHPGSVPTGLGERRDTGLGGGQTRAARQAGFPTAAEAARQRLEDLPGAHHPVVEPDEFHVKGHGAQPVPIQGAHVHDDFRRGRRGVAAHGRARRAGLHRADQRPPVRGPDPLRHDRGREIGQQRRAARRSGQGDEGRGRLRVRADLLRGDVESGRQGERQTVDYPDRH